MSETDHRFKVGDKVKLNEDGSREWEGFDVVALKPAHGIIQRQGRLDDHGKPYYDITWTYNAGDGEDRRFCFSVYDDQVELLEPAFNLTFASPVDNIDDIIRLAELVSKATNLDVKIEKVPPG